MGLVLILVARPIAVWASVWPFRFRRRELSFLSWVGLKGAVPITLATFPLLAGVPRLVVTLTGDRNAGRAFNLAPVVIVAYSVWVAMADAPEVFIKVADARATTVAEVEAARGAVSNTGLRYVLGFSLAFAVIAMSLVWIIPALARIAH